MEALLLASLDYEATCAAGAIAEVARVCSFEDAEDPFTFAITQRALALVGSGLDSAHMDRSWRRSSLSCYRILAIGLISRLVSRGDPMLSIRVSGRASMRVVRLERARSRVGIGR